MLRKCLKLLHFWYKCTAFGISQSDLTCWMQTETALAHGLSVSAKQSPHGVPVMDMASWQPSPLHQTINTSSGESERHTQRSARVSCGQHGVTRGQVRPQFSSSLWPWFAGPLSRLLLPSVVLFSNLETVPRSSSVLCLSGTSRSAWIVYR